VGDNLPVLGAARPTQLLRPRAPREPQRLGFGSLATHGFQQQIRDPNGD